MRLRAVVLSGVLWLSSGAARAGDRDIELLFVDMTPASASSKESKRCVKKLFYHLESGNVRRIDAELLRKRAGATPDSSFMSWNVAQLKSIHKNDDPDAYLDSVVLVDCRPEARQLDVWIGAAGSTSQDEIVRVRLRKLIPAPERLLLLANHIGRYLWIGFAV